MVTQGPAIQIPYHCPYLAWLGSSTLSVTLKGIHQSRTRIWNKIIHLENIDRTDILTSLAMRSQSSLEVKVWIPLLLFNWKGEILVGEISRAHAKVPLSKVANPQMLGQAAQGNLFTLTSLCMSMYNRHNFSIRDTQTRSCELLEYTFGCLYFKMHTAAAGQVEMHCGISSCPKSPSHILKYSSSLTETTEQWITVLKFNF